MVTKEQAIAAGLFFPKPPIVSISREFHFGECQRIIGPRGGIKLKIETWRANGKCKVWKTRPNEFSLPIKTGFYGPCSYLTHLNCGDFHHISECPILSNQVLDCED